MASVWNGRRREGHRERFGEGRNKPEGSHDCVLVSEIGCPDRGQKKSVTYRLEGCDGICQGGSGGKRRKRRTRRRPR